MPSLSEMPPPSDLVRLAGAARLPSQHPAWVRAAAEVLHPNGDVALVRPTGEAEGLAPLVRRRRGGIQRLELMAAHEMSEPSDLLAADDEALDALTRELRRTGRPLHLERVPATSPTVASLRRAYAGGGIVLSRPQRGTPTLALDATWRDPEAKLSARRRSDLRRARRRAERKGELRFEVRAPRTREEIESALDLVWAVEARSWRAARGGALAQDSVRGPFFRRFAHHAGEAGIFRACFLHVGEQVVAMQYAVACAGAFWLLKIGYDDAFAKYSPGNLLTVASIAHAAEAGLDSYEFLGVREDWTTLWTESDRACVVVRAYPAGLRGYAALAVDTLAAAGRRVGEARPWRRR